MNRVGVKKSHKKVAFMFFVLLSLSLSADENENDTFFENHIRPLLTAKCLECHGPEKQENGLRLDSRKGWEQGGDQGPAIIAGKPESSLLIRAVSYHDTELQMPPKKMLEAHEIAELELWIKLGAPDPRTEEKSSETIAMTLQEAKNFWSFQPLKEPLTPNTNNNQWSHQPIDQFIFAELESRGLSPVRDADKRTLIRRATFDLTGLPPTIGEISEFIEDASPDAFLKVVDRLLASPTYGERWGRHWLDIARYADTAGDGSDYPVREAYKYRDWVIRAFNKDMPFNEFVREQIAGDILAKRHSINDPLQYSDRITATGFLAIGKRYGYKDSPDYQHLDFADVIDTLGRSLQGLSIGCARCHDHKYDPISAEDYYALYGILQSTKWAFPGGEEQKRPAHFPPLVPPQKVIALEKVKTEKIALLEREMSEKTKLRDDLDRNERAGGIDLGFESQKPKIPLSAPWVFSGPLEVLEEAQSPFQEIHPKGKVGVRLGSGQITDGIRYVFKNGLTTTPGQEINFALDFRTLASEHTGSFRFYLGQGVIQSLAVQCSITSTEFSVANGNKWETVCKLEPGKWQTLRITINPEAKSYSGFIGTAEDLTHFSEKDVGPNWNGIIDCFICDGAGHVEGAACARDIDNIGLQPETFQAPGSTPVIAEPLSAEEAQELKILTKSVGDLEKQLAKIKKSQSYQVAYGVSEAKPVDAHFQFRGEPTKPGKKVTRRFLEVLGGQPVGQASSGSGRLELADQITHANNPLTARVFVNRVWQWHFGQGIVSTPSDFGSRGAAPTHPKLLDWLAINFIKSGWSIKSLHRLIMSSRTYQLASIDHKKNLLKDPENRFIWRYSRQPLDAESIRDAILSISGKLDRSIPKSHPFPPVNQWGFSIHNPFHAVYDSNHRSVYLMIQRNRRHPYLSLFDAADPNQSIAKRRPTTTPTQALFLQNSRFIHDNGEQFAKRIMDIPGDDSKKILWAFETAHGTIPNNQIIQSCIKFLSDYRDKIKGAESKKHSDWEALSRVLLTSNSFLFVE